MFATIVNQEMKVLPVVVGQASDSFLPILLSAVTPGQAETTFDRLSVDFNNMFAFSLQAVCLSTLFCRKIPVSILHTLVKLSQVIKKDFPPGQGFSAQITQYAIPDTLMGDLAELLFDRFECLPKIPSCRQPERDGMD